MYVKSHADLLPSHVHGNQRREKGKSSTKDLTEQNSGTMKRSDSGGIHSLFDGDHRRREGTNLIARQIELENMKVR